MIRAVALMLVAVALAAFTYLRLERLGRRGAVPFACRTIAWGALGLLLLNVSCPVSRQALLPLVLLDASLSMTGAGGRWAEARDSARALGEVLTFGDERPGTDTTPSRGRSLLQPALVAASAADRPIVVVTDGAIEDIAEVPADVLARAGVRIFARTPSTDVAVTRVSGPARITAGDSISLEVEVLASGPAAPDSAVLEVRSGETRLARREIALSGGSTRVQLSVPSRRLSANEHLLTVTAVAANDAEPRTDTRLHLLAVAETPGIVLIANPADWDSRFLFRALRDVADLPLRGYARIDADRWHSMSDLSVVSTDAVRRSARRADLLVLKGGAGQFAGATGARGIWRWPSGATGADAVPGDWYLSPTAASPLADAFLGAPVDSFPPATQISTVAAEAGDWVALVAQAGRRGAERPVVSGSDEGRVRRVTVAADGLWRWPFRGGSSEQAYRAWVASTVSWLLGGADSVRGLARPERAVVANGRPVVFEWIGGGPPRPVVVTWAAASQTQSDTLRFDGAGRAAVRLPVGEYRYRLEGGGAGTVAVERYSDEWLSRSAVLAPREPRLVQPTARTAARDWLWLFGVAVLAFSGEWLARRRLGLR